MFINVEQREKCKSYPGFPPPNTPLQRTSQCHGPSFGLSTPTITRNTAMLLYVTPNPKPSLETTTPGRSETLDRLFDTRYKRAVDYDREKSRQSQSQGSRRNITLVLLELKHSRS